MRIEHVYSRPFNEKKSVKRTCVSKAFLLAGMLVTGAPFVASAQVSPAALNGTSQNKTVCSGITTNIGEWLKVFDPDCGETITWTVLTNPANGTLSGGGATATVTCPSSGFIPAGMTYEPSVGATTDYFQIYVDDGVSVGTVIDVHIVINAGPSLMPGTILPVCAGATTGKLSFTGLTNVGPDTARFAYTGAMQSWTVPDFVTNVKFDLMGAQGGKDSYLGTGTPGMGGRVQGTLTVNPGSNLNLFVGGAGTDGVTTGVAGGGFNGGGDAYFYFYGSGGAGGGATDIRIGGATLGNRKVVAGGGGGNGADLSGVLNGGNGGGLTGGASQANVTGSSAKGGTQALGGAPASYLGWLPGGFGTAGNGGAGSSQGISGGGGGGYYGGGGGVWNGGGGGSSFADPILTSGVTHTQGANTGNGAAAIYYEKPGTYTIIWDGAPANGFENQASLPLPTATHEINFPVPATATPGLYTGKLIINNGSCNSPEYPISITVKPKPTVVNPGTIAVCDGTLVPDITFSGTVASASDYKWVNDNPAIGLVAAGEGHILSFLPVNGTPTPVVANITVTPVTNGCIGDAETFQIKSNPIPTLNSTLTPAPVCNNTIFSYIPTSLAPGTSFAWSRDAVTGIDNTAASGVDNPNETLTNSTTDPVAAVYVYTLTANGCVNSQNVTALVQPTPVLTSVTNPAALCNNAPFVYNPTSSSSTAVLTWSRAAVTGISNAAGTGAGAINEVLMNTTTTPKAVTYTVNMAVGTCNYNANVLVTVNPPLALTSSTMLSPVCDAVVTNYNPTVTVPGAVVTWTRPVQDGIGNPTASGSGAFSETLINTTPVYDTAVYTYTMAAFGCTRTQNVSVPVKPRPRLSSSLTPADVCTNMFFDYTPASATTGSTFIWARDVKAGIGNGAMTGANNVHEVLINLTELPITVPYIYTSQANGCLNQDTVKVVVNPMPRLNNNLSSIAVCDSAVFTFNPGSNTPGAAYSWSRAYTEGITNLSATGTNSPEERLNNTTYINIPVTYVYTLTAAGCMNSQNVTVQVRPSAILETKTAVTCSGAPFNFVPRSYTDGSSFAWSRTAVTNITPATASGTGNIADNMTNGSATAVTVTYDFALTYMGCTNAQKLVVTVNPAPAVANIVTKPSATLCNNSMYQNFGADGPAGSGYSYSWSATNATVNTTGDNGQFAVVSFTNPGSSVVTLTTRNNTTGCTSKTDFPVTVSAGSAIIPEVVYYANQFICKTNQTVSYQWGYDDAKTLDSTVLVGETNQNYTNAYPDFNNKYYWVITNNNGCMQKTYFNRPTAITDVNDIAVDMKVYPNPATDMVNVEISTTVSGKLTMEVYNLMGQKIQSVEAMNNKAQINIGNLPAGAYVVDCYNDGMKVAAARFIKN